MKKFINQHNDYINHNRNNKNFDHLHNLSLAFIRNERFVHLVITLFVVLFTILFLFAFLFFKIVAFIILFSILLFLSIFYLKHYYLLENTVQKWSNIIIEKNANNSTVKRN